MSFSDIEVQRTLVNLDLIVLDGLEYMFDNFIGQVINSSGSYSFILQTRLPSACKLTFFDFNCDLKKHLHKFFFKII